MTSLSGLCAVSSVAQSINGIKDTTLFWAIHFSLIIIEATLIAHHPSGRHTHTFCTDINTIIIFLHILSTISLRCSNRLVL